MKHKRRAVIFFLAVILLGSVAAVPLERWYQGYPIRMQSAVGAGGSGNEEAALAVSPGEVFQVRLPAAGGTGYAWLLEGDHAGVEVLERKSGSSQFLFFLPGGRTETVYLLRWQPGVSGPAVLQFSLRRGPDDTAGGFRLTVSRP